METRAHKNKIARLKKNLKFQNWFCVEARGTAGGLCLMWNNKVKVQICAHSLNFIHTFVSIPSEVLDFQCTFVYAPPVFNERKDFWYVLRAQCVNRDSPWVCMGDFNEMLSLSEKEGLRPSHSNRLDLFRELLNDMGLMDLDLKGNKFTWKSNPRDGFVIREKIDRVLTNWAWRTQYPHALAISLPIITSDHAPIVLQLTPKNKSGVHFKYEAFWDDHDECKEVVQQSRNQGEEPENNMWETLIDNTKRCQKNLQTWHKKTFKRADEELLRLKRKLNELSAKKSSDIDWDEIRRTQMEIDEIWKREEKFWGQRSRLKWLKWGDRNSKFFHATTIQRRERNRLQRIKNERGEWIEGQGDIEAAVQGFFNEIYQAADPGTNRDCIQVIPKLVTQDMNETLMKQVTEEEIKQAVFAMGALKAPGPDGLSGLFFQNHWGTIKKEVCVAVCYFFEAGVLPPGVNETTVALVPKVPLPESITQLRPISCCNFLYKIISKVMVSRLKYFLGDLIHPTQSAFVGGRQIQDNLVIAQEVFHSLKRKERGGIENIAVKLDMNKAYDRLDWDFINLTLLAFGFAPQWVKLVMTLVTTVSYKYKINGYLSPAVLPHRGLRQGDPLSPYLFILAAEVLSHMILQARLEGNIHGIQLARDSPFLTHLFFADDALLFAKADEREFYQFIHILNVYSKASGQRINLSKSGLICGKFVQYQKKMRLAAIMEMQLWEDPGRYLGLPGD